MLFGKYQFVNRDLFVFKDFRTIECGFVIGPSLLVPVVFLERGLLEIGLYLVVDY